MPRKGAQNIEPTDKGTAIQTVVAVVVDSLSGYWLLWGHVLKLRVMTASCNRNTESCNCDNAHTL